MEDGFESEVEDVRPRGVACCHSECRWWAVVYTTLEDNPEPWPGVTDKVCDHDFEYTISPLWYACGRHTTALHKPLPADFGDSKFPPVCERCGSAKDVMWVGGMTAYHFQPTVWEWIQFGPIGPPSPNRDGAYCRECADEYRTYWTEQWEEYRSSAGY